jgi:hypothetical protein
LIKKVYFLIKQKHGGCSVSIEVGYVKFKINTISRELILRLNGRKFIKLRSYDARYWYVLLTWKLTRRLLCTVVSGHIFNALFHSPLPHVRLLHFQMRLSILKEMLSLHLATALFSLFE